MLVLLFAVAAFGCGGAGRAGPQGVILTPAAISTLGARSFKAPPEKVFRAAEGALATLGYSISFSDPEAGVIKTSPKDSGTIAQSHGTYGRTYGQSRATFFTYSHSYALKITPDGSGTSIEATPKLFENGGDISDLAVWDLGGNGQPKLWEQLFNEIASNLGETASSPPAQAGQKSEP